MCPFFGGNLNSNCHRDDKWIPIRQGGHQVIRPAGSFWTWVFVILSKRQWMYFFKKNWCVVILIFYVKFNGPSMVHWVLSAAHFLGTIKPRTFLCLESGWETGMGAETRPWFCQGLGNIYCVIYIAPFLSEKNVLTFQHKTYHAAPHLNPAQLIPWRRWCESGLRIASCRYLWLAYYEEICIWALYL